MKPFGVGFDLDHTLCIDNKLERVAFLRLLERIVDEGGSPRGGLAQETEAIDALLSFQRSGGCTLAQAVDRFVRDRGVEPTRAHEQAYVDMTLAMAPSFIVPDPQAKALLGELARRDVAVGVLSNGWNPLQTIKARSAGYTGVVLASADLGVQKPAPAAFGALLEHLEVPPERCYYVGDDPTADVGGALGAGLRAVWLDNEGKTYPGGAPRPTHVIPSLLALLDVVGEAVTR